MHAFINNVWPVYGDHHTCVDIPNFLLKCFFTSTRAFSFSPAKHIAASHFHDDKGLIINHLVIISSLDSPEISPRTSLSSLSLSDASAECRLALVRVASVDMQYIFTTSHSTIENDMEFSSTLVIYIKLIAVLVYQLEITLSYGAACSSDRTRLISATIIVIHKN